MSSEWVGECMRFSSVCECGVALSSECVRVCE